MVVTARELGGSPASYRPGARVSHAGSVQDQEAPTSWLKARRTKPKRKPPLSSGRSWPRLLVRIQRRQRPHEPKRSERPVVEATNSTSRPQAGVQLLGFADAKLTSNSSCLAAHGICGNTRANFSIGTCPRATSGKRPQVVGPHDVAFLVALSRRKAKCRVSMRLETTQLRNVQCIEFRFASAPARAPNDVERRRLRKQPL